MTLEEYYQGMHQRSTFQKRAKGSAFICIEQDSFVENVRKTTLSPSIPIT
jgi:hypothetical protein